jgi:mRNA-degrading endonuclease HigB of HigAB toxin-antitoxin module
MRLIGKEKLLDLSGINDEIDTWLSVWITELSNSSFNQVTLRDNFPRMVNIKNSIFIFPVYSSNYSVKVILCFKRSIALISEVIKNE